MACRVSTGRARLAATRSSRGRPPREDDRIVDVACIRRRNALGFGAKMRSDVEARHLPGMFGELPRLAQRYSIATVCPRRSRLGQGPAETLVGASLDGGVRITPILGNRARTLRAGDEGDRTSREHDANEKAPGFIPSRAAV